MKPVFYLFAFLFLAPFTYSQNAEFTFNNPKDSTVDFYITVQPKENPSGLLLLLPGFGELPYNVFNETHIPEIAYENGLITIVATLHSGWQTFYVDADSQKYLDNLIADLAEKYPIAKMNFYLGGFSLGASGVVKYAERANSSEVLLKPNAIFAIDPPLDFERFYISLQHISKYSKNEIAKNEANYLIDRIKKEFGCTPAENIQTYYSISPYSYTDTTQTKIKNLINCPIRLITEPDIIWQMSERNRDYYDLNSIDCASAINTLRLLGNKNAELVVTTNKGVRQNNNQRNPHSWSIADPNETIEWLLKFEKK